MKHLIRGIGILTAFFAAFFFLLVADKLYYKNSTTTYDISLDRRLSGQEIQEVAESAGVTFRITYYSNTNFGHHDLEMVFINPDNIKEGKQPSIFPSSNIVYTTFDANSDIKLQYLTLLSEDEADADKVVQLFAQRGVQTDIEKNSPIKFHVGMVFSTLNLSFFLLLTVLLFLSIAAYYVQRLKEIGVLKLSGWTGCGITFRLISPLLVQIYIALFAVLLPMGGYILYKDSAMISIFLQLTFWMCLFLSFVFLIASLGGVFFIHRVDRVGAIKNYRNNKLIFGVLLIFKTAITVMLIFSMNTILTKVISLQATNAAIDELKQYDFYKLSTPVVPEDSALELFNNIIESCEDTDIFNYAVVSGTYSAERLKTAKIKTASELIEKDKLGLTQISANLLSVIELLDTNGQALAPENVSASEIIWLIPIHFQTELEEILSFFDAPPDVKIVYIQDGQTQNILTQPGYYTFDSIYEVQPLQKVLYLSQGEVLLTKDCAELLQYKFLSTDADGASVRIESQNTEYGIFQGNLSLTICESLFRVVINFASFILCAVAVTIIFMELRKKEIGVHRLLGRYPFKAIGIFAGVNLTSTILTAMTVWPGFLLLALLESMLYCTLIKGYLRQKAVLALKGA